MLDSFGRNIRKLRISVTEACNLRCRYCMPVDAKFTPENQLLPLNTLFELASILVDRVGVDEIRITGGEPLLRKGVPKFVGQLKTLKVKRVGLTTNGFYLKENLPDLLASGLDNINLSLDTLREKTFTEISRLTNITKILESLETSLTLGFQPKLNCVVMRSYNFSEVQELLDFALSRGLMIRFLEVMNIGIMKPQFASQFVSASEILKTIGEKYFFKEVSVAPDSTARVYETTKGPFGIIASESMPFCNSCSRLRLTSKGKVMGCLFREESVDLKPLLGEKKREDLVYAAVEEAISHKPTIRMESTSNQMYTLGG